MCRPWKMGFTSTRVCMALANRKQAGMYTRTTHVIRHTQALSLCVVSTYAGLPATGEILTMARAREQRVGRTKRRKRKAPSSHPTPTMMALTAPHAPGPAPAPGPADAGAAVDCGDADAANWPLKWWQLAIVAN